MSTIQMTIKMKRMIQMKKTKMKKTIVMKLMKKMLSGLYAAH